MIRIAKLTDYGVALMIQIAHDDIARRDGDASSAAVDPGDGVSVSVTARDLSEQLGLPLPTVSKLLKLLSREDLLDSQRGARGGYSLARAAERITLADLVSALEGPVSMTECSTGDGCGCALETNCHVKSNWRLINTKVMETLAGITLREMAEPGDSSPCWEN